MIIRIRTHGFPLFIPVPTSAIGLVIRLLPERMFEELWESVPEPYRDLVSRESIGIIVSECLSVIKENRGLEIVHVQAADGTFVSIEL